MIDALNWKKTIIFLFNQMILSEAYVIYLDYGIFTVLVKIYPSDFPKLWKNY